MLTYIIADNCEYYQKLLFSYVSFPKAWKKDVK